MKPSPTPDPAADEQAALWAARLDGSSLSKAERTLLDTWLAQHPSHRTLLSQYCQFSADLEEQLLPLVATGRITLPEDKKAPRQSKKMIWIVSATLAVAAAVAVVLRTERSTLPLQTLATSMAERQSVTLPDGTHVELNAQTHLAMESNGAERHVRLTEGEAFFEVSKDLSRPFIVQTPRGSVRVTGTKFNVQTEPGEPFKVTVVEGSVQVSPHLATDAPNSAPYSLGPNDQLSADAHGVAVQALSRSALDTTLSWRQGQVVFDGTPLAEALARFARYHGRVITTSPDAANLRVGGRFSLDDLDGFFAALEDVLPVHATRDSNRTVRVDLRSTP